MQSLWPEELFALPAKNWVADTLDAQATALSDMSKGALAVVIATSIFENIILFRFSVAPAGQEEQAFELFVVRSQAGGLPCVIEDYHTGLGASQHLETQDNFISHLAKVLRHPRTEEILRILLPQSGDVHKATSTSPTMVADVSPQRIEIDGKDLVRMRLRDLVGYLHAADIKGLLGDPDDENSNFKLLQDDRYLLYIAFAAPVTLHISREEIEALQTSAHAALALWGPAWANTL